MAFFNEQPPSEINAFFSRAASQRGKFFPSRAASKRGKFLCIRATPQMVYAFSQESATSQKVNAFLQAQPLRELNAFLQERPLRMVNFFLQKKSPQRGECLNTAVKFGSFCFCTTDFMETLKSQKLSLQKCWPFYNGVPYTLKRLLLTVTQ